MHRRWLAGLSFEHAAHSIVLEDCIAAVEAATARRDHLEAHIEAALPDLVADASGDGAASAAWPRAGERRADRLGAVLGSPRPHSPSGSAPSGRPTAQRRRGPSPPSRRPRGAIRGDADRPRDGGGHWRHSAGIRNLGSWPTKTWASLTLHPCLDERGRRTGGARNVSKGRNPGVPLSLLVPAFDGAFLSSDSKDALWARFYMGAPRRQSGCVPRQAFRGRHGV